jgi:hypothetical protein
MHLNSGALGSLLWQFRALRAEPSDDGGVVSVKPVLRQQLPDLQLGDLQKLLVVHKVCLVQEHYHVGHRNLVSQ